MNMVTRSLLRYFAAVIIIILPSLLFHELDKGIIILVVVASFKFLLYDGMVKYIKKLNPENYNYSFYIAVYITTAVIDSWSIFAATAPAVDAGFSIIGPIMFTPLILFGAAGVMLFDGIRSRKAKR